MFEFPFSEYQPSMKDFWLNAMLLKNLFIEPQNNDVL